MLIIPAIDIIDGQPVRLYQGDYKKVEVVGKSVVELAKTFEKKGARYIHLVDLDGAKEGTLKNKDIIVQVVNEVSIPVEVGGGIRNMESIQYYLENGVNRIILGTSALEDTKFLEIALEKYGEKIAVGIDCKHNYVCGRGWLEKSQLHYLDFAKHMEKIGVKTIIVTDITKDGTLSGPNLSMLKQLKKTVSMNIIASGGIKTMEHIKQVSNLELYGVITGKAVYHKTLDLKEAIEYCEN